MVVISEEDYLAHYGILRRSGRYPWGSGGTQNERNQKFIDYISEMKAQGLTDTEIAKGVGISTTQYRAARSIAKNELKQAKIRQAQRLAEKGNSNVAIGKIMGINESSVRALLEPGAKDKADQLKNISEMLKTEVEASKFVDIGAGVENHIGISKDRLKTAVAVLGEEGYEVHKVKVKQLGTGFDTEIKVLAPPGTTQKEVWEGRFDIKQIRSFSDNAGEDFSNPTYEPLSVDPSRVAVRYAKDGGAEADGVIYVREGAQDLSMGNARYAQVRIKVGDEHYLKGMAVYKDDLPEGVDLLFNTNKDSTGNKMDALKKLTSDPDLPFGSVTRPLLTKDSEGNDKVASALNIVNEEGEWSTWSRNISSQALSKQSPALARTQLDMTFESRKAEYDAIMSMTNPTIKKKLLETFAEGADSAAVHLKAAGLERQNWNVILPVNSIAPTEIYAPNYKAGEEVVLIRYPHGGTFEIPRLTVNNRNPEARKLLGQAKDAVGIHHTVAERLSGADFDGDTVLVIPNSKGKIKSTPALEGLKNFNPTQAYKAYPGMVPISASRKQQEMGAVSNLITDMTIRKASHSEIARAVRHSMVVIDAEKHNLDFKQSAIDNGIKQLKAKYQTYPGSTGTGASTLISRATSQVHVPERKPRPQKDGGPVDKLTGKKVFVETGATRVTKSGKVVPKTIKSKKLAETDDANTLSSGTPIEKLYATHSNKLKNLANQARLSALNTPPLVYSPSAKKAYAKEVASLDAQLSLALKNKPLERQAQIIANSVVKAKRQANPGLENDSLKKIEYQALEEARARTGAGKQRIKITPKEWEAIQAGAISNSKLSSILENADLDVVKELASPRPDKVMTSAKTTRAKAMLASGYTRAEVAGALGVSITTLDASTVSEEE